MGPPEALSVDRKRTFLYFSSFVCMGLAVGVIGPILPKLKQQAGDSGAGVHPSRPPCRLTRFTFSRPSARACFDGRRLSVAARRHRPRLTCLCAFSCRTAPCRQRCLLPSSRAASGASLGALAAAGSSTTSQARSVLPASEGGAAVVTEHGALQDSSLHLRCSGARPFSFPQGTLSWPVPSASWRPPWRRSSSAAALGSSRRRSVRALSAAALSSAALASLTRAGRPPPPQPSALRHRHRRAAVRERPHGLDGPRLRHVDAEHAERVLWRRHPPRAPPAARAWGGTRAALRLAGALPPASGAAPVVAPDRQQRLSACSPHDADRDRAPPNRGRGDVAPEPGPAGAPARGRRRRTAERGADASVHLFVVRP